MGLPRWLSGNRILPADAGDTGNTGLIPGSGRSPGGGNANQLQYSCLENSMTEEAGGLWYMWLQRVGHYWATEHAHNPQAADCYGSAACQEPSHTAGDEWQAREQRFTCHSPLLLNLHLLNSYILVLISYNVIFFFSNLVQTLLSSFWIIVSLSLSPPCNFISFPKSKARLQHSPP